MSLPVIFPPPINPMQIDRGVAYTYVIPAVGATTYGFTANSNFSLSISGNVLTYTFTGRQPTDPNKTFDLEISATNSEGVTKQKITLQITMASVVTRHDPRFFFYSTNGTDFSMAAPDNVARLKVGQIIAISGGAYYYDSRLTGKIVFVKSISGSTFKISATIGGAALSSGLRGSETKDLLSAEFGFSVSGSTELYVGNTSGLQVDDYITIGTDAPTDPTGATNYHLPAALSGPVYVKSIVDAYRITVASTAGGTAITASENSWVLPYYPLGFTGGPDIVTHLLVSQAAPLRACPDITSAASSSVATGASVSYTITSDITADSYLAQDLPTGLSLDNGVITGTAPASAGAYAVKLGAFKGNGGYFRYWILVVGGGSLTPPPGSSNGTDPTSGDTGGVIRYGDNPNQPGLIFDGDFTAAKQIGLPEWEVPFAGHGDPGKYLYSIPMMQLESYHNTPAKDSGGPYGGYLVADQQFHDEGGGVISFRRVYAFVPRARDEYESYVYSYQFAKTGADGSSTIQELPVTTKSRVAVDYFHTSSPSSITLPKAPRALVLFGALLTLNGWGSLQAGQECLAEDATLNCWQGNIYERRQRFIVLNYYLYQS